MVELAAYGSCPRRCRQDKDRQDDCIHVSRKMKKGCVGGIYRVQLTSIKTHFIAQCTIPQRPETMLWRIFQNQARGIVPNYLDGLRWNRLR